MRKPRLKEHGAVYKIWNHTHNYDRFFRDGWSKQLAQNLLRRYVINMAVLYWHLAFWRQVQVGVGHGCGRGYFSYFEVLQAIGDDGVQ